jgi:GNAT superfamily N-acetyltransferase
MALSIDPATRQDIPLILDLIRELAEYEHEPYAAQATPQQIEAALFGERPAAEAVISRVDGEPAGWALWFQNFSTWTGQPGLWLEDLFVRPQYRRSGVGKALMAYLARL